MPWWEWLIIFWVCTHTVNTLLIAYFDWIYHPAYIYKHSKTLNWFGAVFLYILWFASVPIYGIIGFMIWACTVGRGND